MVQKTGSITLDIFYQLLTRIWRLNYYATALGLAYMSVRIYEMWQLTTVDANLVE